MAKIKIYTLAGEIRETVVLPPGWPGIRVSHGTLHQVVVGDRTNQRQGAASTKTRGEVSGGGRKPWRQKGTGRARHGSIRSPLWRGGGTIFGPRPRAYRHRTPQPMRQRALLAALASRLRAGVVRGYELGTLEPPKTRVLQGFLAKLGLGEKKVLLLSDQLSRPLLTAGRNLPGLTIKRFRDVGAYDILVHDAILLEGRVAQLLAGLAHG